MDAVETETLLNDVASVVKLAIERAVAPLSARMDAFEAQFKSLPAPRDGADGKDGKDADPEAIIAALKQELSSHIASIVSDVKGENAEDVARVKAAIDEQRQVFANAVSDIQDIRNGMTEIKEEVGELDEASKFYLGKVEEVTQSMEHTVNEAVKSAIDALPKPKDGRDGIDGKDGAPGQKGEKGDPGQNGRDGLDVKDMLRADGGRLIAVMSDGTTKDLGQFVGNDGAPGHDGKDGIGFDDLDLVEDEDGLSLKFVKGDIVKLFPLPMVLDRGVFREGKTYRKGSGVSWGGRFWIAQETTSDKPEGGKSWRLAVNKGRDGKDAKKAGE